MITRARSLLFIKKHLINYTSKRNFGKPPRCEAHMNELPVPCLPWDPWYTAKQNYFNTVLFLGVTWFLFSFGMMIYTGSFYLNASSPAQPAPPSDMVVECDDSD